MKLIRCSCCEKVLSPEQIKDPEQLCADHKQMIENIMADWKKIKAGELK